MNSNEMGFIVTARSKAQSIAESIFAMKHQTPNTKHRTNTNPQTATRIAATSLRIGVWRFFGVWCLVFGVFNLSVLAAPPKPNILVILADDLGYADVGVQGCKDV